MENITEEQLGKGCVLQPLDERDLIFEKTLGAGEVFSQKEWEEGYDIEKELGIKLKPNNQWTSMSCVTQAFSKYEAVLNFIETGIWREFSAKAMYSQINLGYLRGSYLRDGAKLIVNWGAVYENIVKSYRENGTTDEEFMRDNSWFTPAMSAMAKTFQSKEYRFITGLGIDYFARAIKDGHGMVAGVTGTNNGTWLSAFPVPPDLATALAKLWGHGIYFGKVRLFNGKKQIGLLESWGEEVGEDGWQWLGEEWFVNQNYFMFNPLVLIDKPNNEVVPNKLKQLTMVMIKKAGEPAIYAPVGDVLIPFSTTWENYLVEFPSAKIVELSAAEFAKYRITTTLGITKK